MVALWLPSAAPGDASHRRQSRSPRPASEHQRRRQIRLPCAPGCGEAPHWSGRPAGGPNLYSAPLAARTPLLCDPARERRGTHWPTRPLPAVGALRPAGSRSPAPPTPPAVLQGTPAWKLIVSWSASRGYSKSVPSSSSWNHLPELPRREKDAPCVLPRRPDSAPPLAEPW